VSAPEISPPLTASVVASTDAGPSEGRTSGAFGQATPPPPDLRTRIKDAALALVRDPNPILLKELRATLRTPLFVRFLYLCTGLVAIVVLMGSATFSGTNTAPAEVGRAIFHLFFGTLALVLVFAAPSQAASAFTLEKETKTWESLLLSGMSPTRIVLGKFFAVYGSILLVVIAVAPVIGVGFLFGGVSPLAVLVGFGWLLGALAVAVSFGIAVSVRMESTRSSVSATTVIFIPLALMWSAAVVALGEPARSAWGTPFDGPIWFGPAFAERYDALDAWLLLIVLPGYFFSMLTWLNLAGSIAGVNAPGVDRSTGLKLWAIYAVTGTAIAVTGAASMLTTAEDMGEGGIVFGTFALAMIFPVVALVFANEPPLPPRVGTPRGIVGNLLWDTVGPGAGPTLRFTLLVLAAGMAGLCGGPVILRHALYPVSPDNEIADLGALVLLAGGVSVFAALAATAAWLRSILRNGAAARMLSTVLFIAMVFGSMVVASVLDPRAMDRLDNDVNPIIGLSPVGPFVVALRFVDGSPPDDAELATAAVACLVYGLLALALWLLVEVRARQVAALVEDHRAKLLVRLGPVAPRAPGGRAAIATTIAASESPAAKASTASASASPASESESPSPDGASTPSSVEASSVSTEGAGDEPGENEPTP
jgi:hypothetical protein